MICPIMSLHLWMLLEFSAWTQVQWLQQWLHWSQWRSQGGALWRGNIMPRESSDNYHGSAELVIYGKCFESPDQTNICLVTLNDDQIMFWLAGSRHTIHFYRLYFLPPNLTVSVWGRLWQWAERPLRDISDIGRIRKEPNAFAEFGVGEGEQGLWSQMFSA